MLKNHLASAYKNLLRQRTHTLIMVLGLVLGMTSCILILLYVMDELGFDRWLPQAKSVYRLELVATDRAGNVGLTRKSAFRARRDLQEYFPQITAATRIIDQTMTLGSGKQQYFETVWFVDPAFLDVFQLPLLAGDSKTALTDKSALLISAAMAQKYFPEGAPLGRVLTLDGSREYRVAGVFDDMPKNSHVQFNVIVPYDEKDALFNFGYSEQWSALEGYTYVKLAAGTDAGAIDARLPGFLQHYSPAPAAAGPAPQVSRRLRLLNLLDIHLSEGGVGNIKPPGSKQMLATLSLIALLVLVIASINFVNLSTVRSLGRAREVSIRKAVGALRKQVIAQFLCESVLVSLLALVISASLVELVLPAYNTLLGRDIDIEYPVLVAVVLVFFAIVLGLINGFLPAHRLSAWRPATILRSGFAGARQHTGRLQAVLVTAQFTISATLIMTTLVVLLQQAFIDGSDLGYQPENKLVIRNLDAKFIANKRALLAAEIAGLPQVLGTAFAAATPGDATGVGFSRPVTLPGHKDEPMPLYPKAVDANFFDVYAIAVISGRKFSNDLTSDRFFWAAASGKAKNAARAAAIVNSSAVRAAGFASADAALGNVIRMQNAELEIVGVVPDVNFQSLRTAVTPNMYIFNPESFITLTVAYAKGANVQALRAGITKVWDTLAPGFPPVIEFVEDNVRAQYAQDRLQFLLITVFSSLAIAIACLGLYALAAWSTRRRTREIGIRKVHGAMSADILKILLLQFSKPVVMANFLAWPVAWYVMNQYLNGFAYRIHLGPALFVLASVVTVATAWSAIILHVVKAANAKPVLALRYE